ncbi:type IV secretory system conjugative DNA transfer family protein [Mycobacterium sp. TY815]|uniref:type IV secretory system conjugative DNA transfer family protein n=1 Tax=Mycobacterium sp. TY815 TaxID=3050581 RepID=UPI002740EBF0|nr:type IV secretory system conjugative DNA transfer family protein [Mycobacterium sp. TY815]MDP7707468.1 type IV secretory system conjugative DNA transfer family protein [Mycobacterium sp. TY815]
MYVKPDTPYCGFMRRLVKDPSGRRVHKLFMPRTGPHVLITAPTGTGKTRRVMAPAAVLWGGPAVVVSSKDDLMQLVMQRRYGPTALVDLRPVRSPVYPVGVDAVAYDPTATITTPLEALTIAETIMQMATVGLGAGADQVSDGGVWESQAAGPLAAFLYAASPQGNNEGMDWVLRAVDNIDTTSPDARSKPGWLQAAAICHRYEVLAIGMNRILEMEPRQRDSVAITMRKAITPWLRQSLMVAGLKDLRRKFDPAFLDDPHATLFVLAPADGTAAGAAVTLLDSLVRRWRDKTSALEQMHRLLMVVDELPNTAPIPSLRRIVGEGRGLGINLMAVVQASCQLDTVYGPAYAHELRHIFPVNFIMYGAHEEELLTPAEDWSGLTFRRSESYGQADGHKGLTSDFGPALRWQELLPPDREHARVIVRGGLGHCVESPDWSRFCAMYDAAVQHRIVGSHA